MICPSQPSLIPSAPASIPAEAEASCVNSDDSDGPSRGACLVDELGPSRATPAPRTPRPSPAATDPVEGNSAYSGTFWSAYIANTLVAVAIALLYRYADFVTILGGSEWHLGWIVGVGMVGSFTMRMALGVGIDRRGPRIIWLGSTVVFILACFAHLGIQRYDTPWIYLLRIAFCSAVAGFYGASTAFVAVGAPLLRVAELVGMLGTSGFLGMVVGAQLGDFLCGTDQVQRWQVDQMFVVAGLLACAAIGFICFATRGEAPRARRRMPPLIGLLRRYTPVNLLLIGVASGIGLGLPQAFLRTYVADLDIDRIGLFFGVYAPAAIVTRVLTRRWFARFGLEPIIILGTVGQILSVLLFLTVRSQWHLVIPGLTYGIAHALLFPSVLPAGSRSFPNRYRGLATTLVLASWDFGLLIGSPTAGMVLHYSEALGLPPYPTMFLTIAVMMAVLTAYYALTCRQAQPAPLLQTQPPAPHHLPSTVRWRRDVQAAEARKTLLP